MAAAEDAVAADIICSLRGADLAGWTPPWRKRPNETDESTAAAATAAPGELSWPAVARGKRSRRRSPSASASAAKGRFSARSSPASPLDYSAVSGSGSLRSGASTSGGEDGAFCSPWHRRAANVPPPTTTTKVRAYIHPHVSRVWPPPTCFALGSSPSPTTSVSLAYLSAPSFFFAFFLPFFSRFFCSA
jgi:hypothetical protein